MKVKLIKEIGIISTPIERNINNRLDYHKSQLTKKIMINNDDECNIRAEKVNPVIISWKTSKNYPHISYSLMAEGFPCNIRQLENMIKNKEFHVEDLIFRISSDEQIGLCFREHNLSSIFHQDYDTEFTIDFINKALKGYFQTKADISDYLVNSRYAKDFLQIIEKEKRATSHPATPDSEFLDEALNRDLVYMIIDEYVKRL